VHVQVIREMMSDRQGESFVSVTPRTTDDEAAASSWLSIFSIDRIAHLLMTGSILVDS
jgi:hypothetical protein